MPTIPQLPKPQQQPLERSKNKPPRPLLKPNDSQKNVGANAKRRKHVRLKKPVIVLWPKMKRPGNEKRQWQDSARKTLATGGVGNSRKSVAWQSKLNLRNRGLAPTVERHLLLAKSWCCLILHISNSPLRLLLQRTFLLHQHLSFHLPHRASVRARRSNPRRALPERWTRMLCR